MTVDYRLGDTREVIATIPDGSVSLVACSPPFIALRSYLPVDHPDKGREIGSEPDPGTFLQTLLALTADWGRVLAPWGSIAIELGDTYSGSSMTGGDDNGSDRYPGGRSTTSEVHAPKRSANGWPMAKSLALVPQLYAASLAYGRNLLTGEPCEQWRIRNMVVWHRPNPAVGALGDKYRPSTSYITVATRGPKRYFDLTGVRGVNTPERLAEMAGGRKNGTNTAPRNGWASDDGGAQNPAGAPPLDCWFDEHDQHDTWTITTQPSSLAHYAMWPAKLAERLILSMCPAEVCAFCREPRRRIENVTQVPTRPFNVNAPTRQGVGGLDSETREARHATTTGWTACGCGVPFTPGTVLDPFAGTGTTLAVADLHGRNAIGIDIDARNPALYEARRAEVSRNLFSTKAEMPGQIDLFGAAS